MDLSLLLVGVMGFALAFGLVTGTGSGTVVVSEVVVADAVARRGYTAEVVTQRLLREMSEIRHGVVSERSASPVTGEMAETPGLTRAVRRAAGLVDTEFRGNLAHQQDRVRFQMHGNRKDGSEFDLRAEAGQFQVDALISDMAVQMTERVAPYFLALHYYLANRDTGCFDDFRDLVTDQLRSASPQERPWFRNLLGIALYTSGQDEAALAQFEQAATEAPEEALFPLNVAWGHFRRGRYTESLPYFAQAMAAANATPEQRALAGAYWGAALGNLSRQEDAAYRFLQAMETDPNLAEVHLLWGRWLRRQGKAAEAAAALEQARILAPRAPVATEALLGLFIHWDGGLETRLAS